MLNVELKRSAGVNALILDGHAGAGEHGNDIVCASASMLAYTLANAVHKRHERKMTRIEPIIVLSPGSARIVCVSKSEAELEFDMIFDVIADGYRMLARDYPDNVVFSQTGDLPERA